MTRNKKYTKQASGVCFCSHPLSHHGAKGCTLTQFKTETKFVCKCTMFRDNVTRKEARNPFADYSVLDEQPKTSAPSVTKEQKINGLEIETITIDEAEPELTIEE